MKKEGEHQGSNYKWPMSDATKARKDADVAANKAAKDKLKDMVGEMLKKGLKQENINNEYDPKESWY